MKTAFLLLCILGLSTRLCHGKENSDEMNSFEECLEENGIKEENFNKMKDEEDPKIHCIMACVFEKEGMLKNGEIDKVALKEGIAAEVSRIKEPKITELVDDCMVFAKGVSDICEATNRVGVCLEQEMEKFDVKIRNN